MQDCMLNHNTDFRSLWCLHVGTPTWLPCAANSMCLSSPLFLCFSSNTTMSSCSPLLTQELAWASYALLLNTNICGLAVYWDGRAVLARGQLGAAALGGAAAGGSKSDPSAVLDALSVAEPAAASRGWRQGPLYCPDKAAIAKAGAGGWPCVPAGAESLLVQPLLPFSSASSSSSSSASGSSAGGATPQGFMLLLSERPRALSGKERAWAAAVAAKLHDALQQG